ncbi:Mitochondrial ribosome small subunit biogenesis protein, partial [Teratosphaeriaceae sp. CCFEE 6253]
TGSLRGDVEEEERGMGHAMSTADTAGELVEASEEIPGEPETHQESDIDIAPTTFDLPSEEPALPNNDPDDPDEEFFPDPLSALPPPQPASPYPLMPLVSSLPGTTALPIRLPYNDSGSELIDLPGIPRSGLATHIRPQYHSALLMRSRVTPEQYTIRAGQSLLLGGVVRITPRDLAEGEVVLAYPFLPPGGLEAHVTGTHKAVAVQTGVHSAASRGREGEVYGGSVESIATEDAKARVKSAGVWRLKWDVTKRRAGPLTEASAAGLKAGDLPFVVWSADVVVEGVGWVELVCQVRRKPRSWVGGGVERDALGAIEGPESEAPLEDDGREERGDGAKAGEEDGTPAIEVFTPEGKFVGCRRPMGGWLLGRPRPVPVHKRRERPRQSIGMVKRRQQGARAG